MPVKENKHPSARATPTAEKVKEQLRRYRPGTRVWLIEGAEDENEDPYITVFPVPFTKIGNYFDKIANVVTKLSAQGFTIDSFTKSPDFAGNTTLITSLTKFVLDDLMDLVDECCSPSLKAVDPDHYMVPLIIGAWVKENFLGERLHPWIREMKDLLGRMTGGVTSLSALLSQPSSPGATQSVTSSIDELPDDLIRDGVMSNFGATFQPPTQPEHGKGPNSLGE